MPRLTPELMQLAIIAAPAALSGGVLQINLLVGRQVASFSDGALQYLNLADRLYQLPLGVVAIAIGVVLLPELSRRLGAEDEQGGRDAFNRAMEFALLLTLPAAVALVLIPGPLVTVLFERGAFLPEDSAKTALALTIYGFGLPAFVLQKVLQPLYFARSDTKSPFRYALVAMVINAVLAIGLAFWIGFYAAALATTVAAWAMVWMLWRGSRAMGPAAQLDRALRQRVLRMLLACATMGLVLWGAMHWAAPVFEMARWRILALVGLVTLALISYFGSATALGAVNAGDLRRALRKSRV